MKKLIQLISLSLVVLAASRAETSATSLDRTIEQALYRGDAALLERANAELAAALAAAPDSPELRYLRGFALYAASPAGYAKKDMKAVRSVLEEADKVLKTVKGEPWAAEAEALRGMITGQLIGVRGGASAMTLGPKMNELTSHAREELPASPRVLMAHGVTLLNTPEMFGGDVAEAQRLFEQATAILERESGSAQKAGTLAWGRAMALSWLAQARLKTGDIVGAKLAAEQALALEPDYRSVRHGLLPAIVKKIPKKS